MSEPSEVDGRELFESNLDLIEKIIDRVAVRHGFGEEDKKDFKSRVMLKLFDGNCAVLTRFGGRCELSTYLTTVVTNLARDFRIRRWGKWRPSAEADRLGPAAVQLETLVARDGFGLETAIRMVRENSRTRRSVKELRRLARRLTYRSKRRFSSDRGLLTLAAKTTADERVVELERRRAKRRIGRVLRAAMEELTADERSILRMRFRDGLAAATIALHFDLDRRQVYRRIESCLRRLRRALLAEGIGHREIQAVIGCEDSGTDLFARRRRAVGRTGVPKSGGARRFVAAAEPPEAPVTAGDEPDAESGTKVAAGRGAGGGSGQRLPQGTCRARLSERR